MFLNPGFYTENVNLNAIYLHFNVKVVIYKYLLQEHVIPSLVHKLGRQEPFVLFIVLYIVGTIFCPVLYIAVTMQNIK